MTKGVGGRGHADVIMGLGRGGRQEGGAGHQEQGECRAEEGPRGEAETDHSKCFPGCTSTSETIYLSRWDNKIIDGGLLGHKWNHK